MACLAYLEIIAPLDCIESLGCYLYYYHLHEIFFVIVPAGLYESEKEGAVERERKRSSVTFFFLENCVWVRLLVTLWSPN